METTKNELQVLDKFGALQVTENDPRLPSVATHLRLRPGTLLAQIQRFIPNAVEQQIYLALAHRGGDFRPISFAKILASYRGNGNMTLSALNRRELSDNIFFSTVDGLEDFIKTIQEVLVSAELQEFSMTLRCAMIISKTYGENADKILSEIIGNADDILDRLGRKARGGIQKTVGMAVDYFVREVLPACETAGLPAPVRVYDYFEEDGYAPARRAYAAKHKKGRVNIAPPDSYEDGVEKD